MKRPIRIGIMIGSDSDLPQCILGFKYLAIYIAAGIVEVVIVITNSIHRNTEEVLANLREYKDQVDFWIVGAGWANHLTGTVDAYLRYTLKNNHIKIVGVAFEDVKNEANTRAAVDSIIRVPGTQVIYPEYFVPGEKGFFQACQHIVEDHQKFKPIELKPAKGQKKRSFDQAVIAAEEEKLRQAA